jgi:hypothetical protein
LAFWSPARYLRTALRSWPVWRAIAEIDLARLRRACTSKSSSHVSKKRVCFEWSYWLSDSSSIEGGALFGGATRVENFDEPQWEISATAVNRQSARRLPPQVLRRPRTNGRSAAVRRLDHVGIGQAHIAQRRGIRITCLNYGRGRSSAPGSPFVGVWTQPTITPLDAWPATRFQNGWGPADNEGIPYLSPVIRLWTVISVFSKTERAVVRQPRGVGITSVDPSMH